MERLTNIQALRGVAVLAVCFYHFFPSIVPGGFVGVDVFFVLSGFFVAKMLDAANQDGKSSVNLIASFYKRRFMRLVPSFTVVVLFATIAGWLLYLPDDFNQFVVESLSAVFFVSNLFFLSEAGYFDSAAITKPLLHTWSLGVEMQFYLLFPILYLVYRNKSLHFQIAVLVASLVASFCLGLAYVDAEPSQAFYNPILRFWEILAGVILFICYGRYNRFLLQMTTPRFISAVFLVCIAITFFSLSKHSLFPGFNALWVVLFTFFCALGSFSIPPDQKYIRTFVYFGDISYPLYLVHWPMVVYSTHLLGGDLSLPESAIIFCFSIAIAHLLYVNIEKKSSDRVLTGRHFNLMYVTCIIFTFSLIGTKEYRGDGNVQELISNPRPAVFNYGCHNLNDPIARLEFSGGCWLSDGAPKNLWIGDSHMAMYRPVVWETFTERGNMMLIEHYCFPFASNHSFRGNCTYLFDETLDFINRSDSIDTVYLTGYWSYLMTGGSGEEGRRWRRSLPIIDDVAIGFQNNANRFFESVVRSGKRVVFIKDIPDLDFDVVKCVSPVPIVSLDQSEGECYLYKDEFFRYAQPYIDVVDRVLDKWPQVEVLDPVPAICGDLLCRAVTDGLPLYENGDHLNVVGARMVFDHLFP